MTHAAPLHAVLEQLARAQVDGPGLSVRKRYRDLDRTARTIGRERVRAIASARAREIETASDMRAVVDLRLPRIPGTRRAVCKLVLLDLASRGRDGWITLSELAASTETRRRQARRAVRALEDLGLVVTRIGERRALFVSRVHGWRGRGGDA